MSDEHVLERNEAPLCLFSSPSTSDYLCLFLSISLSISVSRIISPSKIANTASNVSTASTAYMQYYHSAHCWSSDTITWCIPYFVGTILVIVQAKSWQQNSVFCISCSIRILFILFLFSCRLRSSHMCTWRNVKLSSIQLCIIITELFCQYYMAHWQFILWSIIYIYIFNL